ncbi:gag-pol polyprotein [Trifolium medium]|uniref:Gag-pol polyprotein n=1 Tax=Trifolium medium TaxID=97028 RepID=A0A392NF65_9FABA|nr:gag-pol polyprotein [Trifolium medium]
MLGEKPDKTKTQPKKDERTREERGRRAHRGGYPEYTPLNTPREKILQECLNTEFADAGIRPPKELRENPRTDKSKFCKYHRSAGHDTEDCIQLKEAIEELIKQGKLNRYTKEMGHGSYDKRKYDSSRRHTRRSESPKRKRSPRREPSPNKMVEAVGNKEDDDSEREKDPGKRPFVAATLNMSY